MNVATSSLFSQIAQAKSLRGIDRGLSGCEGKLRHPGMAGAQERPLLSRVLTSETLWL